MSEITQKAIFAREVQRRLDELFGWIVDNVPDKKNVLSHKDFLEAGQTICKIASDDTNIQHIEPEPEDGGAQYISDNPAPWP